MRYLQFSLWKFVTSVIMSRIFPSSYSVNPSLLLCFACHDHYGKIPLGSIMMMRPIHARPFSYLATVPAVVSLDSFQAKWSIVLPRGNCFAWGSSTWIFRIFTFFCVYIYTFGKIGTNQNFIHSVWKLSQKVSFYSIASEMSHVYYQNCWILPLLQIT